MNNSLKFSILFIFLLVTTTGCDAIYGLLDKEGAQEKKLVGEIVPFERNVKVEEAQALLKLYGYDPGKVDGSLGTRTRNAVERFQQDNSINPSRFIDKATWDLLQTHKNNGFIQENFQLNVMLLQDTLTNAGFDPGKIDGKFGKKTERAVKKFQEANGLKVDGKPGFNTLTRLSEYLM